MTLLAFSADLHDAISQIAGPGAIAGVRVSDLVYWATIGLMGLMGLCLFEMGLERASRVVGLVLIACGLSITGYAIELYLGLGLDMAGQGLWPAIGMAALVGSLVIDIALRGSLTEARKVAALAGAALLLGAMIAAIVFSRGLIRNTSGAPAWASSLPALIAGVMVVRIGERGFHRFSSLSHEWLWVVCPAMMALGYLCLIALAEPGYGLVGGWGDDPALPATIAAQAHMTGLTWRGVIRLGIVGLALGDLGRLAGWGWRPLATVVWFGRAARLAGAIILFFCAAVTTICVLMTATRLPYAVAAPARYPTGASLIAPDGGAA